MWLKRTDEVYGYIKGANADIMLFNRYWRGRRLSKNL
jgi:hypothetical protein